MIKNATANLLRYLAIALVGSVGLAGIIASGGGGDEPEEAITSYLEGHCKNKLDGGGEDDALVSVYRPLTADKEITLLSTQQAPLPSGEFVASTTTDSSGHYQFPDIPANETYFLTYTKEGFLDEAYFEVRVEQDTLNILEPVPLVETQYETITGMISGSVVDAETDAPLDGVVVRVRDGINNRAGTVLLQNTTDTDGNYTIGVLTAGSYTLEASFTGYQTVYFDALVLDVDGDPLNDETVVGSVALVPDSLASSIFSISGTVYAAYDIDSDTGPSPLGAASVHLREGINTTVGTVIADRFTDTTGLYSFSNIFTGQYTLEGDLEGTFNPGFIDFTVASDLVNQNVTLMPLLSDGSEQITIVLTWGTSTFMGGGLFEIEPTLSLVSPLYYDTDGLGPSTTLLKLVDPAKRYEYFVRDFDDTMLYGSKAQARVYRGNNLIFTFDLPLSDPDAAKATDWHVFTINDDTILPVNDLGPRVLISSGSASEGDPIEFEISLNFASSSDILLELVTEDGTATSGDYETTGFEYSRDGGAIWLTAAGTQVSMPAGSTSVLVRVDSIEDFAEESDETFTLRISEVISGSVGNFIDTGTGTILNDDFIVY
ncbi:MAG: carboxypeptidase-like regulatory domain-containing protein [Pseudomonadota bacterium]